MASSKAQVASFAFVAEGGAVAKILQLIMKSMLLSNPDMLR